MRRFVAAILMTSCLLLPATAQESAGHLNPVIARLAAGKTVYGLINTGDLSLAHARDTARAPVDFSPEVEAAFQRVLTACKAHKVACGITAGNATDVVRRVKEGWNIIRSTVPAITEGRAQLGDR